jgi:hypothetical protein
VFNNCITDCAGGPLSITWPNTLTHTNAVEADPMFREPTDADYRLQPISPAIDAGVDLGQVTDHFGNPIYGTPDIGAVEYQPPYAMGTDPVDVSANVRVYADGKFRNTAAPSGTTAILAIRPQGGWPTGDYREWMNLCIVEWQSGDSLRREWTETSPGLGDAATVHTVGGLEPGTYCAVSCSVAGGAAEELCTCAAGGDGTIDFTYVGGYAGTVRFVLVAAPGGDDHDGGGDAGDGGSGDGGGGDDFGGISCSPGTAPAAPLPAALTWLLLCGLWILGRARHHNAALAGGLRP